MNIIVKYVYRTFDLGCDCCSDSESYIEVYSDECELYYEAACFMYCENEEELRSYLRDAHPDLIEYVVDPESEWF